MQNLGVRVYTVWLGIKIMCQSGTTYLPRDCLSDLAVQKSY